MAFIALEKEAKRILFKHDAVLKMENEHFYSQKA